MTALARPIPTPAMRAYRPFGAALALMVNKAAEVILSGPAGTGKSRSCLEKVHLCALKYPGCRWLVVRKTRESLTESALVTFEEKVLPKGSPIADGPQRRMRQAYHYPNGSEVVVGGLDKPSKVMSTEYDGIYVQEAIELSENDWESLTTRLRNGVMPYQQIIADTNPDAPTHWLKRRADAGRLEMLESRHEDNPTVWDHTRGEYTAAGARYVAKLDALTGVRHARLRAGKWVGAEGVVYDGWNRNIHLIDRFPIPENWRRIRSIDFGYTNAFACEFWAIDGDGRMFLYREIYRTQRLVSDHAAQIKELSRGERFEATVADHDAEDRATLHAAGIQTIPAKKAIKQGIEAVQHRLRPAGDARPRLFVFRDALVEADADLIDSKKPYSTEQEMDVYIWPKGQDGKTVKELPVDADNHGLDALRYAVAYLDLNGPPARAGAFGDRPAAPPIYGSGKPGQPNGPPRPPQQSPRIPQHPGIGQGPRPLPGAPQRPGVPGRHF